MRNVIYNFALPPFRDTKLICEQVVHCFAVAPSARRHGARRQINCSISFMRHRSDGAMCASEVTSTWQTKMAIRTRRKCIIMKGILINRLFIYSIFRF